MSQLLQTCRLRVHMIGICSSSCTCGFPDALGASIELGRNRLRQESYLRDLHARSRIESLPAATAKAPNFPPSSGPNGKQRATLSRRRETDLAQGKGSQLFSPQSAGLPPREAVRDGPQFPSRSTRLGRPRNSAVASPAVAGAAQCHLPNKPYSLCCAAQYYCSSGSISICCTSISTTIRSPCFPVSRLHSSARSMAGLTCQSIRWFSR